VWDFVNDYNETRKDVRNVKENIFFQSFITFVYNFLFETQNLKSIFGLGSKIDFLTFIGLKFFEKKIMYYASMRFEILFITQFLHFTYPTSLVLPTTTPLL